MTQPRNPSSRIRAPRIATFAASLAAFVLAACSDGNLATFPDPSASAVAVVVNSTELTLTVFPVDGDAEGDVRTIPLGPEGTPVGGAVRGALAAIPLGVVPAVAIVDLEAGAVTRTIALPAGSGATGAHFANDSIVLVGNSALGTVSPVNVLRGTVGAQIETGRWPNAFVEAAGRIFVVNGELADFAPDGPGTLTVLDAESFAVEGTIPLSGLNSGGAAVSGQTIFVVHGGTWGDGNGSLSAVDAVSLEETAHHTGFGDLPAGPALGGDGRLYLSSWAFGVVAWSPGTASFHRGPDAAIAPDGMPAASGLGIDGEGRLWTLFPDCNAPARALLLDATYAVERSVPVGVCPAAILFTEL